MGTGEETKRGVCVFPQEIILNRTEQNWSHRVEFQSSSSHWLPGLPGSMFPSKRQRVAVAAAARADRLFPSEPGAGGTRNKGWSVANRQGVLGPMVATPLKSKVHRDPTTPPPLWGCSDDVLARGPGTRWRPDSCRCDSQGMGINKPRPPGDAATQAWLVLIVGGMLMHPELPEDFCLHFHVKGGFCSPPASPVPRSRACAG